MLNGPNGLNTDFFKIEAGGGRLSVATTLPANTFASSHPGPGCDLLLSDHRIDSLDIGLPLTLFVDSVTPGREDTSP